MAERGGVGAQVMGLAGWRCSSCGGVELDRDSAMLYALACDELANLIERRRARDRRALCAKKEGAICAANEAKVRRTRDGRTSNRRFVDRRRKLRGFASLSSARGAPLACGMRLLRCTLGLVGRSAPTAI